MKKIFSILLSLALVVSLSLVVAAPVMAVELPSISPTTAVYDLDNPGHVEFNIDFGDATHLGSIEDDNGTLTANTTTTYIQFEDLVVISEAYLDSVFTCVDEEWIFQVNIQPFGTAFLTVSCIGTPPALQDDSGEYDFWAGGDVVVGMDLNIASAVSDVKKGLVSIGGANWVDGGTTLTIKDAYLSGELASIGDDVELTVIFDSCYIDLITPGTDYHTATLTIEAVGVTSPRLAPTSATYDKCNPGDLEFTITWDGAANIDSVQDVTIMGPGYPQPLTVTTHYTVASNTLTIKYAWLAANLALSTTKVLEVNFDDTADSDVTIIINAAWSDQPFMGVTSNIYTYDLDTGTGNLGALGTGSLANFGCATNVTGVHDMTDDIELTSTDPYYFGQYTTLYIAGYGYLVCILKATYLQYHLTYLGDSMELSVAFDAGANATWFINAVGTQPSIDPTSAEFNLDDPQDVTTDVDLGPHAASYTINDPDGVLTLDYDYTVSGDTVSINASYLSGVLAAVDDVVVLTFDFDEGENANLTIKAVGTPLCFIATAAGADAPELDILREFRDKVLRPNSLGAKLVSLYYEVSPPIAELISQNGALKTAVKACLIDPIVAILNWSQCLWS